MRRVVLSPLSGLLTTAALILLAAASTAEAQVTPAAGYTPPDDTPSIRIGVTIFGDYTVQTEPKGTDVDGNEFTPNSFNITRAYLNVTGSISHLIAFRVTPDIVRETAGTTTHAVRQLRLPVEVRLRAVQPRRLDAARLLDPLRDATDTVDRLHRQRVPLPVPGSDAGRPGRHPLVVGPGRNVSTTTSPATTATCTRGFYNGENYNRPEANDQKAFMVRGTVRPLPMHAILRGLRVTGFYDFDAYVQDAERRRGIVGVTFENPYVNAGLNGVWTKDQTRVINPELDGSGYSIWATPKTAKGYGWEGLLRFDHLEQGQANTVDGERNRTIAGIAYWFPHQGNVATALLARLRAGRQRSLREPGASRREAVGGAHVREFLRVRLKPDATFSY